MHLSAIERDPKRAARLWEMGLAELRHARTWAEKLGIDPRQLKPTRYKIRTSTVGLAARIFGVKRVLPWVVRSKADGVRAYARDPEAREIAHEERSHHIELLEMAGAVGPSERASLEKGLLAARGGAVRAAVLGVNDGLVSNFSLVMGVAGGTTDPSIIVLAGAAGLFAGAFSMAAGEYVSVRSQREVYERLIELERTELAEWPEEEEAELREIYKSKGLTGEEAAAVAGRLMADPDAALDAMSREELGLSPSDLGSPWTAAISSFAAFVVGASVPLLPFLLGTGNPALVVSAGLSVLALAIVGGALALMTSRNVLWGMTRMLIAGGAAAAVTFMVGRIVGVSLGG